MTIYMCVLILNWRVYLSRRLLNHSSSSAVGNLRARAVRMIVWYVPRNLLSTIANVLYIDNHTKQRVCNPSTTCCRSNRILSFISFSTANECIRSSISRVFDSSMPRQSRRKPRISLRCFEPSSNFVGKSALDIGNPDIFLIVSELARSVQDLFYTFGLRSWFSNIDMT